MKAFVRIFCLSAVVLATLVPAAALRGQVGANEGFQPVFLDLPVGLPGRVWFRSNFADQGLGYEGSYLTLGGKKHLWEDVLDGRWLCEMRGHLSYERGNFFCNVGIERVFSIDAANADVSTSVWFDYDDDQNGNFAHTFTAMGASAQVKTNHWDLIGNGYFPIGTDEYSQGDITGANCFLGHSIVLQAGLDVAPTGFDITLRTRPYSSKYLNGNFDIGGYAYDANLIDSFAGIRTRLGAQFWRGCMIQGELNYDNRFDITGVLQFAYAFGVNARGAEYGLLGRDLEPTVRNDHIVRYNRELILAFDPDTGRPYNAFHVDNLADPAFGDGTAETPFAALKDAEAASGSDDVIFVNEGDGTDRNMNEGIVLKNGQLLLFDGTEHLIPIQQGRFFRLCNDIDGNHPTISNRALGVAAPVVTLANRNTVRGGIIDGSGATYAIRANGGMPLPGNPRDNGIIEDVTIIGNPLIDGISLNNISGDWSFRRNNISTAARDGIFISNAVDPTSAFVFEDNIVSGNGRDGIHMEDYDGTSFTFMTNTVSNNGRHGVRMERFANGSGLGADYRFVAPTISGNGGEGLSIVDAFGDIEILNPTITNNLNSGINLTNFLNKMPLDAAFTGQTFIGTTTGGTSTITGNGVGAGAGVSILLDTAGSQQVTITNSTISNGGTGIHARSGAIGSELDIDIVDNIAVSNNQADGMRFVAIDGGFLDARVENTGAALQMAGNGANTGSGIVFLNGEVGGSPTSTINGLVRNVNIAGVGTSAANDTGVLAIARGDSQTRLTLQNITVTGTAGDGMRFDINTTNATDINSFLLDNLTITNSNTDGIEFMTTGSALTDFVLTNSTITGAGSPIPATAQAIDFSTSGTATRVFMRNNTLTGATAEGLLLNASGGELLAFIDGNTITGNGGGVDPTNLPYFDGVNVQSDGATVNLTMINNLMTGNFDQGLDMSTSLGGTINALLVDNNIAGNDIGEDAPNPPITGFLSDMYVTNGVPVGRPDADSDGRPDDSAGDAGTICLAMSNNLFQLGYTLSNNGAPAAFVLELDGLTNGPPPTLLPGPGSFTTPAFGTTCAGLIDTATTMFEAAQPGGFGFPDQDN